MNLADMSHKFLQQIGRQQGWGRDGLGGSGGGDSGINPSQIIAWPGMGMPSFSGALHSNGLGSMTWITEPSLHQF
jgi:hypothetical protein